jgi:hypothetical protein
MSDYHRVLSGAHVNWCTGVRCTFNRVGGFLMHHGRVAAWCGKDGELGVA